MNGDCVLYLPKSFICLSAFFPLLKIQNLFWCPYMTCALCLACFVLLCTQCEGKSGTCPPGLFLCDGDRCLPTIWRCDWEFDCSDMTDELDCSEWCLPACCSFLLLELHRFTFTEVHVTKLHLNQ